MKPPVTSGREKQRKEAKELRDKAIKMVKTEETPESKAPQKGNGFEITIRVAK